jgi:hypothetical protein
MDILEHRMSHRVTAFDGVIVFEQIEVLGGQMRELGRCYEYPQLSEWADLLLHQAKCIDVKGLPETLSRFPVIVEGLRSHVAP